LWNLLVVRSSARLSDRHKTSDRFERPFNHGVGRLFWSCSAFDWRLSTNVGGDATCQDPSLPRGG